MITNFRPLNDRVLVKPLDLGEQRRGQILIPDLGEEKVRIGKVVAVGPGKYEFGVFLDVNVKPGEIVILPKIGAQRIEIEDEEYWVIANKEIIATADVVEDK